MGSVEFALILLGVFIASVFFHWLVAIVIANADGNRMSLFFNPIDLYKYTKLNWVGVILVYLLCFVFCPVFVIGGLLKKN